MPILRLSILCLNRRMEIPRNFICNRLYRSWRRKHFGRVKYRSSPFCPFYSTDALNRSKVKAPIFRFQRTLLLLLLFLKESFSRSLDLLDRNFVWLSVLGLCCIICHKHSALGKSRIKRCNKAVFPATSKSLPDNPTCRRLQK